MAEEEQSRPTFGEIFQTAYVTTDMDRALAIFRDRYGIGKFLRSGRRTVPLEPAGQMTVDMALAWSGDTMIEIIQPLADQVAVYADWLPREGFGLRFHHVAFRLHSTAQWDEMLRRNEKLGHRVIFRLTANNTRALYIDTAAELGHYLEYLLYLDPPNTSLPRIPQNVAGHRTNY